jgi:SAM-dependent methyltransferase
VPNISFDAAADYYDATRGLPPEPMARTIEAVAGLLAGRRVLEIGSGTGRFSVPLQAAGIDLVPVDIARRMLAVGVGKGMRSALLADASRLPFRDRAFGAALSVHVLHLVADWRRVVREIGRVVSGDYVAVLDNWDGFSLNRTYIEALNEQGIPENAPGVREREIAQMVPPRRRIEVATYQDTLDADRGIALLDQRTYSSQWAVPDEAHAKAMAVLQERYGGRRFERTLHIGLAVWDAAELAAGLDTLPVFQ